MKKIISCLLSTALLLPLIPALPAAAGSTPSDWAYAEVQKAISNDLITDELASDYTRNITREEFCELVVKLYEKITETGIEPAPDIFEDTSNEEVLKAYKVGIVEGVAPTKFDPYTNITRQEICVMMTRCIEHAIPSSTVYAYKINQFTDGHLIADWAFAAVNYSFDHKIVEGLGDGYLDPLGNVTSEAAILLVNRMYENRFSYFGETVETSVEADIKTSGSIAKNVSVKTNSFYGLGDIAVKDVTESEPYTASSAGSLGQVIGISGKYSEDTIKDATITIEYDPSKLGDADEKKLGVARYDEELGRMVLMPEVEIDASGNTITFVDSSLGEYTIVDEEEWYASWKAAQTELRDDQPAETMAYYDVVFLVDDSGSMVDNDPDMVRSTAVYNFIRSLSGSDGFSMIRFTDSVSTHIEYKLVSDVLDWSVLQKDISNLSSNGGTDISGAIRAGISQLDAVDRDTEKLMVLLTDGKQDSKSSSYDEDAAVEAAERGYKIDIISLGDDTDEEVLSEIASTTGGTYYTSDTADELIGIYKEIKGENIGWDGEDGDNDGLADILEERGMRNQYGIFIKTDYEKDDTDTDTLTDGEEMGERVVDDSDISAKDIQNGVTAYVYYIMKSDPNFKDSDNDGIPDAEDVFPLRADINYWDGEDPEEIDSNNDGISDYVTELIYEGRVTTTDNVSFKGYHFGSSADYDGDGLLNGEELVVINENGKIYISMVSDPTLVNSDGDEYDDYDEVKLYKTDPLSITLTQSELQTALDEDRYMAYNYKQYIDENAAAKVALFASNISNIDQESIYQDVLIKMFDNIRSSREEDLMVQKGLKIVKDTSTALQKAIRALEATEYADAPSKINELEKKYSELLELQRKAINVKDIDKVEELTNKLIDIHNSVDKQYNILNKVEDVPISVPSATDRISSALKYVDIITNAMDFIDTYSKLDANTEIIKQNIYILETLEESDDYILASAAKELRRSAESELEKLLNPVNDLLISQGTSIAMDALIGAAAKAASSATVFWVVTIASIVDAVMGVSETGKEAVQTMIMADVANLLKARVDYAFDPDTAIFTSADSDDLYLYSNLLNARKTGEEMYIDLSTLTAISELLIGWAVDNDEGISIAEDNIEKIDSLISKYSPSEIERRIY